MILPLIESTRSYRRYDEEKKISDKDLREIASALRYCASGANRQRLRLCLVNSEEENLKVFDTLAFAAYLRPWVHPEVGERPTAYIVIMAKDEPDSTLYIDMGIAAEAMLLTARERGIVGCMFRSFDKEKLTEALGKDGYTPTLVISLGYPKEKVVIDTAKDDIKYYRDEEDVHHVPKLPLEDLIL